MTIGSWLSAAREQLTHKGVSNPRLDLLMMLEVATEQNRAYILANLDRNLSADEENNLNEMLNQRIERKPMAYILGEKEFYGRPFVVNNSVLIPRPESESFIELLKELYLNSGSLLDIGTGSGCLAVTAKLEMPELEVYATDISDQAIETAKKNAKIHNAEVNFSIDDLFPIKPEKFNIIFANLPYVPLELNLEKELSYEPKEALFAGKDGLTIIARLFESIAGRLAKGGLFFCESLAVQHSDIEKLAFEQKLELVKTQGLVQVFSENINC